MKNPKFSVTLMDCQGVQSADKDTAAATYTAVAEHAFGGQDGVVQAYQAYLVAVEKHGGTPLPAEAEKEDHDAVTAWEDADAAGATAAFAGWVRHPDGAYFEITLAA